MRKHRPNCKSIGNVDALAVDPDFAAANDPVDVALGHPLADLQQVVVKALPCSSSATTACVTEFFAYFGHFEYTDRDLRLGLKEALTRETVERRRFICNCDALSGRLQQLLLHQPVQDQTRKSPG
jgi:hypothetical protein